jgi:hypothetical protein
MAEIVRKIGKITKYETKSYVGRARILDLDRATSDAPSSVRKLQGETLQGDTVPASGTAEKAPISAASSAPSSRAGVIPRRED